MGLEDAERSRRVDEAVRRAGAAAGTEDTRRQAGFGDVARAATAGTDLGEGVQGPPEPLKGRLAGIEAKVPLGQAGTLEAMAVAAEQAGDPMKAMQIRSAKRKLIDEGAVDMIHAVMQNDTIGQRPDLASIWNQKGGHAVLPDKTVLEKDPKSGDLVMSSIDAKTGAPVSMFIGKTAAALGLVKSTVHTIPQGGSLAITTPGQKTELISGPAKPEFDVKDGILFNKSNGTWQQVGQGEWKLGHVTNGSMEIPVSINSKTGEVQQLGPGGQRTGLQAHVSFSPDGQRTMVTLPGGAVSEFKPATEAKPGSSGVFGVGAKPAVPGQSAQLSPVLPAEQAPVPGAQKAPDGKWYLQKQDGKFYPVTPVGEQPKPAPAPKPMPPPTPAPSPLPQQTRVADSDLPPVLDEPVQPSGTPLEQRRSRAAATREQQAKESATNKERASKERLVTAFRDMTKNGYRPSDSPIIQEAIDTGLLTPEEKNKAERMLARVRQRTAGP